MSSTSSSSSSSSSSVSMPRAAFAETEASIRNFYRSSISAEVLDLSLFTADHIQRSANSVAANTISALTKNTLSENLKYLKNQQDDDDDDDVDNRGGGGDDDDDDEYLDDENEEANDDGRKPKKHFEKRRFTKYTELVIEVLTQIYQSFNKIDNDQDHDGNNNNFYLNLDVKDLEIIFSLCVRTIALLIIVNKSVIQDFASSKTKSAKKSTSFWFEIPNWKSRKNAKTNQLQRSAFVARQADPELKKFDDETRNNKEKKDFPKCSEFLSDLKEFFAVNNVHDEERRKMLKKGLRAVVHLETLAASGNDFWGFADDKEEKYHHSPVRRNRDQQDDEEKNKNNYFEDSSGTLWTPSLRNGCGLLGGISQFVRGLILQMEYEIKRAHDDFDLLPGSIPPLLNPPGWMSRFQPLQGKFCSNHHQPLHQNNIKYWFHVSFENKRIGIKERLLPVEEEEQSSSETPVSEINNKKVIIEEEKKKPQVRFQENVNDDHVDDDNDGEVSSNENQAGDDDENCNHHRHTNNDEDDDDEEELMMRNDNNKSSTALQLIKKKKQSQQPRLPNTKTLHTSEDQDSAAPAPLPTILSRLINDRSRARHEVHTSYEKIISLVEEIKNEIANFSAASESANTLEKVAPEFLASTKKDLNRLRIFSQILQAACAIATVSPRFFFEFDSRQWEKEMLDVFIIG